MDVIEYITNTGEQKRLTKISLLGKGAFGEVYKYLLDGYGYVACKIQKFNPKTMESLKLELKICPLISDYSTTLLKIIINPIHKETNIFVGFSENIDEKEVYTLYNLIDGVDLIEMLNIHRKTKTYIDVSILFRYFKELLDGLDIMIRNKILHRDIKPGNIMLDKGKIKYIDFGFSCIYDDCKLELQGTPNYLSPEGYRLDIKDWSKIDIFSLGVVFFFSITRTSIYEQFRFSTWRKIMDYCKSHQNEAIQYRFNSIIANKIPEQYKMFLPLILEMTQADPEKRCDINRAQELLSQVNI